MMKTKLMLKVEDKLWKKLKSIVALEGKTLNDKIVELIKKEVKKNA